MLKNVIKIQILNDISNYMFSSSTAFVFIKENAVLELLESQNWLCLLI